MYPVHAAIIRTLDFTLLGPIAPIDFTVRLVYLPGNPFCVRACFPGTLTVDGADARWEFSRDLLTEGMTTASGEGDVHVAPVGALLTGFHLRTALGCAELTTATGPLRAFLRATYALVPRGRERLDVDWDGLLAGGRTDDPQEPR